MQLRRILLYVAVLFMAGVLLAGFAPIPPSEFSIVLLLAIPFLSLLIAILFFHRRSRPIPGWLLASFFILEGYVYSQSYLLHHPNLVLPYYESYVQAVGIVEDNPLYRNGKWQYTVRLESMSTERHSRITINDKIRISDKRNGEAAGFSSSPVFYGDQLKIKGLLLAPSEARNPGGYNDREYLEQQGIHARMTIRTDTEVQTIGSKPGLYGRTIARLHRHVWNTLHVLLPVGEAELAGGVVFGFASDLPDEWDESFETLGITHILAASGMNVGLLSAAIFFLFKRMRIRKSYASLAAIGLVMMYVLLSGAGPSVVRAGLMTVLLIVGLSLGRQTDTLTTLSIAALLSLFWNPNLTGNIGFLLSFITTFGLLLMTPRLTRVIPGPFWLRSALAVTLAAQISSLPLLIYFFNQVSPWSVVANLYIMPITFLLVPFGIVMILLGMVHPWLTVPFVGLYRFLMWALVKPMVWLASVTSEWTWVIPSPPIWGVYLVYGGLLCILHKQLCDAWLSNAVSRLIAIWHSYRVRQTACAWPFHVTRRSVPAWQSNAPRQSIKFPLKLGIPIMLTTVILYVWLRPSELRVTFLDVGQGDSALIETPGGLRVLVDGGGIPRFLESDFDVGERIVIPFLRHRGIRTIDYMVATHADEDHVRGLITVVQKMRVGHLIVSGYDDPGESFQDLLSMARKKGIPIFRSQAVTEWNPEPNVTLRFLHPGQVHRGTRSDTNANSVVFELTYGNRTFLFTGDIEGEVESDLFPYLQPVDVLKVPHHGSHYSSTEELLNRLRPHYAVISAGKRNRYHHPHKEVLERLQSTGAEILRTDERGAITMRTDGERLQVVTTVASRNKKVQFFQKERGD